MVRQEACARLYILECVEPPKVGEYLGKNGLEDPTCTYRCQELVQVALYLSSGAWAAGTNY